MIDTLTREDFEALRNFAREPCECPEIARIIADEAPGILCAPCKCRRWLEEDERLAEGLS